MSRPILNSIHVSKDGYVESCDISRSTVHYFSGNLPIPSFLIPARSAQEVIQYDVREITTSQGWVHFRTKDQTTVFSCRLIEDNYMDTTPIYQLTKTTDITLPGELAGILKRAGIFTSGFANDEPYVRIGMKENTLEVSTECDIGWYQRNIECDYQGEQIEFLVNINFLQDMLSKNIQTTKLDGDKMIFEGDNWKHITALATEE
jgi:DNA polymerase III sliding clamp (beta) subunit (PCNA family)